MTEAVTPPNPAGTGPRSTPDPTLLTIDSIRREIAMVNKATEARLTAQETHTAERFRAIERILDRAEEHRLEQKADTRAADDKMERMVAEQIHSLRSIVDTEIKSVRSAGDNTANRLTIVEASKQGQVEQRSESRQIAAGWYALIGAVGGVILVLLALYPYFRVAE